MFEFDNNIFGSRENSEDKNQFFGIPFKQKSKFQDTFDRKNYQQIDDEGFYNHKPSDIELSPRMPGLTNFDQIPSNHAGSNQPTFKGGINDAQKNYNQMMTAKNPPHQMNFKGQTIHQAHNLQVYHNSMPGFQQQVGMKPQMMGQIHNNHTSMSLKEIQQLTKQSFIQQNNQMTKEIKKSNKLIEEQTPMTFEQIKIQSMMHQQQMRKLEAKRGYKMTNSKSQPKDDQPLKSSERKQEPIKPPKRSQTQDKFQDFDKNEPDQAKDAKSSAIENQQAKVVIHPCRNDSQSEKLVKYQGPESPQIVPASEHNATSQNNTNTVGPQTQKSLKVQINFEKPDKSKGRVSLQLKTENPQPNPAEPAKTRELKLLNGNQSIEIDTSKTSQGVKKKHIISFNLKKEDSNSPTKIGMPKNDTFSTFKKPEVVKELSQNRNSSKNMGGPSPTKKDAIVSISLKPKADFQNNMMPIKLPYFPSNNQPQKSVVSQKLDVISDSKDHTYNSCKADIGKEMKQNGPAPIDTAQQRNARQLRSNTIFQKEQSVQRRDSNVQSNKKSTFKGSEKKSNSSRLKVSIDFNKAKDPVAVEEKNDEFLAPNQVKKVTRKTTTSYMRDKSILDNINQQQKGQPNQQQNLIIKQGLIQQQQMTTNQQFISSLQNSDQNVSIHTQQLKQSNLIQAQSLNHSRNSMMSVQNQLKANMNDLKQNIAIMPVIQPSSIVTEQGNKQVNHDSQQQQIWALLNQNPASRLPYLQQTQAPVVMPIQRTQQDDQVMNSEGGDSNYAQDSSMMSLKLLQQEKVLLGYSNTSPQEADEQRIRERQEWKESLMAKKTTTVILKPEQAQDPKAEPQPDQQNQLTKEQMIQKLTRFYDYQEINQTILMQRMMMQPSQHILEDIYLATLSYAAENGSNTSDFGLDEPEKNSEFIQLNQSLDNEEIQPNLVKEEAQTVEKKDSLILIQLTQGYVEQWSKSKLNADQQQLNLNIFQALQKLFQIQQENSSSLLGDISNMFKSNLLESQIMKMGHLQLQNELNYHCKEYVQEYIKSKNQQQKVHTGHLIFMQRKYAIHEIYNQLVNIQQNFSSQNNPAAAAEAGVQEAKFERESIQYQHALQIYQQLQSILPEDKEIPPLKDESINLGDDYHLDYQSEVAKNIGQCQRLATMSKILQQGKSLEPVQNQKDCGGFESYVPPSPKNIQVIQQEEQAFQQKKDLKTQIRKTVSVLENMMKLLGDTSQLAQQSKLQFKNSIESFTKQEIYELDSLDQPLTNQEQHVLLNKLKTLELLSPNKQNMTLFTKQANQDFINSIQKNLNYLMVMSKVQTQRINRFLQLKIENQTQGPQAQKNQEKAKAKYKTEYCNQKILACEIKQYYKKFESLFQTLNDISAELIMDIVPPKLTNEQLQMLQIQNFEELLNDEPNEFNTENLETVEQKVDPPKKRQRKGKGPQITENNVDQAAESLAKRSRGRRNTKRVKQQSSQGSEFSQPNIMKLQKFDSSFQYPSEFSPSQKIFQVEKVQRVESTFNNPFQMLTAEPSLWEEMKDFNKGNRVSKPQIQQVNSIQILKSKLIPEGQAKLKKQEQRGDAEFESPVQITQKSAQGDALYQDESYFLNDNLIPKSMPRETRSRKCKEKAKQAAQEQVKSSPSPVKAKQPIRTPTAPKAESTKANEKKAQKQQRSNQDGELKKEPSEKKEGTEQNESGQNQKNSKSNKKRNNKRREQTDNDIESSIKNPSQAKVQKSEAAQSIDIVVQQAVKKAQRRSRKKQTPVDPKPSSQPNPTPDTSKAVDLPKSPKPTQKNTTKSNAANQQEQQTQPHFCQNDVLLDPNQRYSLVQCEGYQSFEQQPYRIYFTFEVQMIMYIHSYLSKNEVIGLLGGISYDTNIHIPGHEGTVKNLVITKIYTADSCIKNAAVRQKNCEISDEEQIKIQEQMAKDKVEKLAWYHSHPIFEVDPSMQDVCTHYQQQSGFTREGKPFFGVIVGPYWKAQNVTDTQIMVFYLKDPSSKTKSASRVNASMLKDRARKFEFRIISNTKLKYTTYSDIKKMIVTAASNKTDKPEMDSEWFRRRDRGSLGIKYQLKDKFMLSLKQLCEDNLAQQHHNCMKDIMATLVSQEDKDCLENQLTSQEMQASMQLMQQQTQLNDKMHQLQLLQAESPEMQQNHLALQSQIQLDYQQFQEQLQIHTSSKFFSVGDSKKITKFLTKIEQALIKEFKLKTKNSMEQTYKQQKQSEQHLEHQITAPLLQLNPEQSIAEAGNQQELAVAESDSQIILGSTAKPTNNQTGQGMQRNIEELDSAQIQSGVEINTFYDIQPQNQSSNQ